MQSVDKNLSGGFVFDAADELASHTKTRGYDAAGSSGMYTLRQNINAERACQVSSQ